VIFVGNADRMRTVGKTIRSWTDNIKINLKKYIGGCRLDSSGSGMRPCTSLLELKNVLLFSIKSGKF
jgi:hypothetical protein